MKSSKKPASKNRPKVAKDSAQSRRRFRQVMFETLEDRRVLATTPAPIDSWREAEFIPNEVIVRFDAGVTRDQASQALFMRAGAQLINYWDYLNIGHARFANAGNPNAGSPDVNSQLNQIAAVHSWTEVVYAYPNLVQHTSTVFQEIPNDTRFAEMYGLNNDGYGLSLPDADIDAPEAWLQTKGDSSIVVAVLDTGIDLLHPDLKANIWQNPGEIANDGIDNDNNGFIDDMNGWDFVNGDNRPQDDNGHGTHVSGTIGAVGDNNLGVTGVAWNVKIMALKAGTAAGGLPLSAILGSMAYITMMKNNGINIVAANHSWGGFTFTQAILDAFTANGAAGVLDICAAGNSALDNDITPHYPSNYNLPSIVAVAATDRNDLLANFSQWGEFSVDLGAPGVGILSTVPLLEDPSGYAYLDGTSMATPMVTGAAVLLKAFDSTLTSAQLKDVLLRGVDPIPSLDRRVATGGRLNVNESLNLLQANVLSGTVWNDANGNRKFDASESGLANWSVYVDLNNNGSLDSGEPRAVSRANGGWLIRTNIGPGVYTVREIVQPTHRQTFPTGNGAHQVTLLTRTHSVPQLNFGNQEVPGEIRGRKWNDIDGDGILDAGEPGIQGVVIYVDLNNDRKIAVGEPAAVTDRDGNYSIKNLSPGTYVVREVYQPGFVQTFPDPAGADLGGISGVVVIRNTVTSEINFGNRAAFDYGDARGPYPTLISQNGAVHGILQGFGLGAQVDAEANGIPSDDANGDDTSGVDDEDGVVVGNIVPGQNGVVSVTVTTGAFAAGYLQGWIDFTRDGDWNDAGEKIFNNRQLAAGAYSLSFAAPANASLGATYARFRYSLERDIGPTGSALGGEVEDYRIQLLANTPTAVDDAFTVPSDSLLSQNSFNVLANDLPSSTGPAGIDPAGFDTTSTAGGQVFRDDNSTPADFTDDFFRYQPPSSFVGIDTFTYRVKDPSGNTSAPATVTITVEFVPRNPIAIDNTFDVLTDSTNNVLNVLANDVRGTGGALTLLPPGAPQNGVVTLNNNGTPANPNDDFYSYTPTPGFAGSDTFTYTVIDQQTQTASATVWIQVSSPQSDDIIQFELQLIDPVTSLVIPSGGMIRIGDSVIVRGLASDLRGSVIDPVSSRDNSGAQSAYMDLLYDRSRVQPSGVPISFGPQYQFGQSGSGGVPGLIDEVGAAHSDLTATLGPGPKEVFRKQFIATSLGTLQFVADPADVSPDHDITAWLPSTGNVEVVPKDQVFFKASPTITVISAAEGENTNLFAPLDVNGDGTISPIDALLVVNYINDNNLSGASGESSGNYKRDVNHDNEISPIDALLVINYLNTHRSSGASAGGEGEGEDDGTARSSLSPFAALSAGSGSEDDSDSTSTGSGDVTAPVASGYAAAVDSVFARADWTRPSSNRSEDAPHSSSSECADEFFTDLGSVITSRSKRRG